MSSDAQPPFYGIRVGEPYDPAVGRSEERTQLRMTPGLIELALFLGNPDRREVQAVESGACAFAVVTTPHVLLFIHKFDHPDGGQALRWSDSPFEIHRQEAHGGSPAGLSGAVGDGMHILVNVVLVDADTGIVRALHLVTISPQVADALRNGIAAQREAGSDERAATEAINALYRQYPDGASLVLQRAEATCEGGSAKEIDG